MNDLIQPLPCCGRFAKTSNANHAQKEAEKPTHPIDSKALNRASFVLMDILFKSLVFHHFVALPSWYIRSRCAHCKRVASRGHIMLACSLTRDSHAEQLVHRCPPFP